MIKSELPALPSGYRMAGIAFVAEFRSVRVLVAVGAGVVLYSYIEPVVFTRRPSPVTFIALHLAVLAFKLEVGKIMIEFLLVQLNDLPDDSGVLLVALSARPLVFPMVTYGAFFSLLDYLVAL